MRKTRWIMRKIFGSLRSPKVTSFHAAEIKLPPEPRVCSQANFKQKKNRLVFGLFQLFSLYLLCYEIINYVMFNENNATIVLLAEVDFLRMHKQYNSRCYVIYYNIAR